MSTHVPPESVRSNARRGLELRAKYGRGGLSTQEAGKQGIGSGVARARDLAAGGGVSPETLRRMVAFFARHRKNKSGGEDDAGRIAWLLWGGDAGEAWAKRELAGLEKGDDAYPAGALLLPEDYLTRVRLGTMLKGLSHKYVKRVPTGKITKTGKPRYRYYYHAAHGGTVAHSEHFVEGASFKDPEGHWHITGRDGDTVHLRHDETGKTQSMTTGELAAHLTQLHHGAIQEARERATRDLADAKASGASAKQLAALKKRAERVGVVEAAQEAPAGSRQGFKEGEYRTDREPAPPKAEPSGVEYVRAKAGGETSEVDGKFYRGGQLMPIHGKFSGLQRAPVGTGAADSRREGEGSEDDTRRIRRARDAEGSRQRAEEQRKWDTIKAGPAGKVMDLKPSVNREDLDSIVGRRIPLDRWAQYAESLGPDGIKRITDALEREHEAHAGESAEWERGDMRAGAAIATTGSKAKAHEKRLPGSHYTRELVRKMLDPVNHAPGTSELDALARVNEIMKQAEAGAVAKGTPNGSLESPGLDTVSPAPGVVLPPRAHRDPFPFAGYMDFRGVPIHLENLRGSVRQGVDPSGKPWSVMMAHHYGEIESTEGADGDPLDVYVGPDMGSDVVVVVRQVDPDTRAFDEHKAMLGFASVNAALRAYRDQYNRPGFYGGHTTMTLDALPAWVAKNANKAEAPTDEPTLGNLTAALL